MGRKPMIDKPADPRRKSMAEAYRSGLTLQAIGDQHGITRERVRQLLVGLVTAKESSAARPQPPARDEAAEQARAQREAAFIKSHGFKGARQ